jgi:hypothetical protein
LTHKEASREAVILGELCVRHILPYEDEIVDVLAAEALTKEELRAEILGAKAYGDALMERLKVHIDPVLQQICIDDTGACREGTREEKKKKKTEKKISAKAEAKKQKKEAKAAAKHAKRAAKRAEEAKYREADHMAYAAGKPNGINPIEMIVDNHLENPHEDTAINFVDHDGGVHFP